jgi:AcrR family transcriptional regulator
MDCDHKMEPKPLAADCARYPGGVTLRRDRRAEILATAARMYSLSGFHGVSIDDLGAELGITGPAIYRYFSSKEAILAEMLVDISRRLLDGAQVRVAEHADPSRQLAALIDFHTEFALNEPELIAVQYRDLGSAPEHERRQVRQLQRQYVGVWVEVLRAVYPGVSEQRARSSAQAVFGLLNSTPYSGRAGEPRMGQVLRDMARVALAAGCLAP